MKRTNALSFTNQPQNCLTNGDDERTGTQSQMKYPTPCAHIRPRHINSSATLGRTKAGSKGKAIRTSQNDCERLEGNIVSRRPLPRIRDPVLHEARHWRRRVRVHHPRPVHENRHGRFHGRPETNDCSSRPGGQKDRI